MKTLLKMAWRNIWRNTRRTVITIVAVVFAVVIAVLMLSFQTGQHEDMVNNVLRLYPAHVQIHANGYWDDKTIYNSFEPPADLIAELLADERVRAVTTRLSVDCLISSDSNTSGVVLVGVDPVTEFSSIREKIVEGKFLVPGDTGSIVIGKSLAKNLKASIGDELVILTQAYDGSIGAQVFTVSGIFRGGSPEFDRGLALVNIEAAQYLLSMPGLVTELTVMLQQERDTDKVVREIEDRLDPKAYEVMPWQALVPDLVQLIEIDNVFGYISYFIILIVVIFGIMNTILMAVMERYREFGVIMALGTKPKRVVSLVLMESTLIALVGIVIGDVLGFGICYYFTQVPIDLSSFALSAETTGMSPVLYARIYPFFFYVTDLIILVTTILSAVYPAVKAARLSPIKALRYV